MQWDDTKNAGFTTADPWIKVNPNYKEINVKGSLKKKDSIFYYYQKLISLRKEKPIFAEGSYELLLKDHPDIFAYLRKLGNQTICVIANFHGKEIKFSIKDLKLDITNYLIQNYEDQKEGILRPYEAFIAEVKESI